MQKNKENAQLKAIDFFCGAGGMSTGMENAGINVIAGIDIEKGFEETYTANHNNSIFIHADIKKLTFKELSTKTKIKKNDNKLIFIGCSPCQYWSKMNTIKTKSSESKNLLSDFQKFVEFYNPGFVVVENVPGIFKKTEESPLPEFLKFLEKKKYTVRYKTINANHYGVPQNRRRFVLIASRINDSIAFPYPEKDNLPVVKDFIDNDSFYSIEAGHVDNSDFMHTTANLTPINIKRLKRIKKPGGTRLAWKNDSELQIPAYIGKDNRFTDVYGRMWWDKPAPTITTKFHSISNGRFGHPKEHRAISLREGATLQTFPTNYIFKGTGIGSIAKQIGNAVPPLLAEKIGEAIINSVMK